MGQGGTFLEINWQQPNSTSPPFAPKPLITNPSNRETFSYRSTIGNLGTSLGHLQIVPLYNMLQSFPVFSAVQGFISLSDIMLHITIT